MICGTALIRPRLILPSVALIAAALVSAATISAAAAAPKVVASVPPVHSLVASVMAGVGGPSLIVRGASSPHTYALKPSEARLLQEADIVFWIGPMYETFLEKPLASLGQRARVVALAKSPAVLLLSAREGGAWEDDDLGHEAGHGQGTAREREIDGHMYLDPMNAIAFIGAIAETLAGADAANADRYRANAARTTTTLAALDQSLKARLAPIANKPFLVFHDAYQYFERRYGLSAAGSITVSPDRKPGARRLAELRRKIERSGALCVFSEPQFQPTLVKTVIEDTRARTGMLDPVGAAIPPGPGAYAVLLDNLASSLLGCLGD